MGAGRASFEVLKMRDGRWTVETVCDSEADARAHAKRIYADRKVEGIRIIRNWRRADGQIAENTIHEERREINENEPVRIVPIESAAPCNTEQEFYALEARLTINRLLRNYLEKVFLTPTEIIHNYKELKRLQDSDNLYPAAVDRVSGLQAKASGEDSRQRRDFIFKTVDQMTDRAKRAEQMKLPSLREASFGAIVAHIEKVAGPDDRDYLVLTALSRELVGTRNWLGKLQRLIQLTAEEGLRPDAMGLLDGVIADLIGAQVLQDLLGWQPSLASAVCKMIDLGEGKMAFDESVPPDDAGVILNKLFGASLLPTSKAALFDRILRHLRSAQALNRNDPAKETEAFKMVAGRVITPKGMVGGPTTAEALTIRCTRMVEQGGASGRRAAIGVVLQQLPDVALRLVYLLELAASDFAQEHAADIMGHLKGICFAPDIATLVPRSVPPKDRMMRVTQMFHSVMRSTLPDSVRKELAGGLDDILAAYIIAEGIIEKLDHKDATVRERSTWLVQFCAAQILPEGKAMKLARDRVIALLRQPNFDARFVEGVADPVVAQKSLRDFHQLLVKAGFGG